jgi:hypothetical protein
VRDSAAAAYAAAADYLTRAASALLDGERGSRDELERAAAESLAANRRLDDAFRQYLAESTAAHEHLRSLGALAAGASRLRRMGRLLETGQPLWRLGSPEERPPALDEHRGALDVELERLRGWYRALGEALVAGREAPEPERDPAVPAHLLRFAREAAASGRRDEAERALALVWTHEHIHALRGIQPRLFEAAADLAEAGGGSR